MKEEDMSNKKVITYLILNIVGLISMITINLMSTLGIIGGIKPDYISNKYFTILTPPGFSFSIWGIIYLLLILFIGYQIYSIIKKENHIILKPGIWFFLSSVFNISWVFAWHYQMIEISFLCILLLLISLIMVYKGIGIGKLEVSWVEKLFMYVPFSIYLGWITVATLLNLLVLLTKLNFTLYLNYQDFWGLGGSILLLFITLSVLFFRNDTFYALTIIWASSGALYSRLYDTRIVVDSFTTSSLIATITIVTLYTLIKLIRGKIYSF
jgi:hypothetical protein